ncbi:MAG: hypothetical protein L0Z62_26520 [Gemmataceae bacterium]|nr:hypothetical protein [Gemmataceae bacterium]
MTRVRWPALFLTALGLFGTSASAGAQWPRNDRSPREYAHFPLDGDPRQILDEKLRQQQTALDLARLMEKFRLNPEQFKRLAKQFGEAGINDPNVRQRVEQIIGKGTGDPKQDLERLKALQQALLKKAAPPQGKDPQPDGPNGMARPPDVPPPGAGSGPVPQPEQPGLPQRFNEGLQERLERFALDLASRLENSRLGEQLRDNPHWQRALREMQGILPENISDRLHLPARGLDGLSNRLGLGRDWNLTLPDLSRLKMPNLSLPSLPQPDIRLNLPTLSLGTPRVGGGLPALGGPGSAAVGAGLLWVALVVLLAVLLWRVGWHAVRERGRARAAGWRLGPWPLDPRRIATSAELVQAFEYLALLQLGLDARAWNHHEIADNLPAADTNGRQAAYELASLYEQARYAPGEEPLAAPDLDAARRHLCLLAGVTPA